ncbi:MAG TPA: T9SS type A sorting domain-containing protein, partial [Candidatus Udaeobacter sp.]|nr:T9SS type A sorting domain-containing protein [Candidatus Udaeobacter sp.]
YSETTEEVQGQSQVIELHTRPASSEESAVFPTSSVADGAENVTVVPNPYLASAGWDLKPNPTDPTGTKVAFNHLPASSTVRIFTLSGDLVETLTPLDQDGGTSYWDLISRNGQDVASGIYLYSVDSPAGSKIGKLVIVR